MTGNKKTLQISVQARSSEDSSSSSSSQQQQDQASNSKPNPPPALKSPRAARFAEATTVHSPIESNKANTATTALPLRTGERTVHLMPQPQVSDVGFGYLNARPESVEMPDTEYQPPVTAREINALPPKSPLKSPLKSAMKTPGAPPRDFGAAILSPTFREEEILEKQEQFTEKKQANDIKVKTRVRVAKFLLRGVNFSCSLIVLGMLTSTFAIFNATKTLPPRNNLPPWAANQKTWPQVLLLSISCVSLFASIVVFYGYWRGGHKKAQKKAVYYTIYSVAFFIFSIVMWVIGAIVIQHAKNNDNNKDMWGWACVDNARSQLFQNDVSYDLICRLQNWSLVCAIIEIVVEVLTICVYGVVFYRVYSKRQLRRTMAARDNARSALYVAHLRTQPNTPAPFSPRDGGWRAPAAADDMYKNAPAIEEGEVQYVDADQKHKPAPFKLQAPPIRITHATPRSHQDGFSPVAIEKPALPNPAPARTRTPSPPVDQRSPLMMEHPASHVTFHAQQQTAEEETRQEHVHAAPGETVYASVPIPGAYEAPLSPGFEARQPMSFPRM